MSWTVGFVNLAAEAELSALPLDMQSRFARYAELIESFGIAAMREPNAKHLSGKLWELAQRARRHSPVDLCDGERPTGDRVAHVCEENAENASART